MSHHVNKAQASQGYQEGHGSVGFSHSLKAEVSLRPHSGFSP